MALQYWGRREWTVDGGRWEVDGGQLTVDSKNKRESFLSENNNDGDLLVTIHQKTVNRQLSTVHFPGYLNQHS